MKLLVSVINKTEAACLNSVNCDILDIKDPLEGTIGAGSPKVIKEVVSVMDRSLPLSISIGDVHDNPNTMSLALLGVSMFNPALIKIGFLGAKNEKDAEKVAQKIVETINLFNITANLVLVGYADYSSIGCVSPLLLPEVAKKYGAFACMIDTVVKDRKTPFDHIPLKDLKQFKQVCSELGILTVLSGSLDENNLDSVAVVNPDIIGMRGSLCINKSRNASLDPELVNRLYKAVHNSK